MLRIARLTLIWGLALLLSVDAALAGRLFGHCRQECCTPCAPQCVETTSCCQMACAPQPTCGACQAAPTTTTVTAPSQPINTPPATRPSSPSDQPPIPPMPGPLETKPVLPADPTPPDVQPMPPQPPVPPAIPKKNPIDDDPFAPANKAVESGRIRTWTDNTGAFQVRAELVEVLDGKVRLLKDNGKFSTVPTERLSSDDVAFIRAQSAVASATRPGQR